MPSSHLILCRPLLLLPPIPPSITVFSNESTLRMRWPKYGVSALTSFLPQNTRDWSLEWTGWISLQSKELSRVFSNTTVQKHRFFGFIAYYMLNVIKILCELLQPYEIDRYYKHSKLYSLQWLCEYSHCCFHFTSEEAEAYKVKLLPEISHLICDRARVQA